MDWEMAIERNRQALRRIVLSLVAMATLADGTRTHLPRLLHRAVLRLLRPAESAARRLVIVVAREMTVALAPIRPRAPARTGRSAFIRNGVGTGIAIPAGYRVEGRTLVRLPACPKPARLALPLFDTLRDPARFRLPKVATSATPRISGFGGYGLPVAVRPRIGSGAGSPPSPDDPIEAAHLLLRLQALERALDDLPGEAQRFARWRALRARALQTRTLAARDHRPGPSRRTTRVFPLRPGRPPGALRRPTHEVHEVLADLNFFALRALERPDTS